MARANAGRCRPIAPDQTRRVTYTPDKAILVTGATSRVGRLVVEELLRVRVPVRALTRRPDEAALPVDAEVVAGDFSDVASLDVALQGTRAVFLIWTAAIASAPAVIARLASHSGAPLRRVVFLSSPHPTPHPFFQQPNALRGVHAGIERMLAEAMLDVAILRPGIFASNALHWWAPQIRNGDVVRWPYGAAETAPIDERDIAAVAARVLLGEPGHADHVLTGPESLSQAEQVRAIGEVIGRPLRFEELSPDEFRRETAATWPGAAVEMLLDAWRATLGHSAFVTRAVEEIVGAPARSFHQWAADNAGEFVERG